jgi:two-component system sensor histidine kinase SenX3
LAIVKHVAANHKGEIALWSKVGTGSTFTLRIPVHLEADHEDHDAHPFPPAGPPALGTARREGPRWEPARNVP